MPTAGTAPRSEGGGRNRRHTSPSTRSHPPNTTRRIGDGLASLGKHQIIEGVICQLEDFFGLELHRAKTLAGLLARLAAKGTAHTCGRNGSTTPSVDRCAAWQACWSSAKDQ